jgi:tellurite resistance protein
MDSPGLQPEHVGAIQYLFYGHQNVPKKSDFEHAWKAIKVVAAADGQLSEIERLHLVGKMCAIGTPGDVVQAVLDFDVRFATCEALVAGIDVPDEMRAGTGAWVVYEALSVAMADGELPADEHDGVRRTAVAMGVSESVVGELTEQVRQEAALRERRIQTLASTIPSAFQFSGS